MGRAPRLICALCAGLLILTGCQPSAPAPASPTPSLPAARIHSVPFTPTPASQPDPTAEPTFTPAAVPLPDSEAELARAVHGARLIAWLEIPRLNLIAPVTPAGWSPDPRQPESSAWDNPGAQVGWALSSALPGDAGNVLLFGHNNIDSSIFKDLWQLENGDSLSLTTGETVWPYRVAEVHILDARQESQNKQIYAEYLRPSRAPRLTILSCWPPDNNTHRVVIVAYPES